MEKKYSKGYLYKMDAVDIYKLVLKENIKRFPNGFWKKQNGAENAIKCIKWLIEESLNLSDEEIKDLVSVKFFKDNKLYGLLQHFDNSPYKLIDLAYPNKFKEWEFKAAPKECWCSIDKGVEATKWLIEKKLNLSDDELKKQLSRKLFKDNNLDSMLLCCFNNSPYKAINSAYPKKFEEWEFENVPRDYWNNKKNGIKATKWLVEKRLKLSDEELKEQLSVKMFFENNLRGMLKCCFNTSPYCAINAAYPGKFKQWEFKHVPKNYWNEDTGIEATKWLIENKLKLSKNNIKEHLSQKLFIDNNLLSMLQNCFNGSPYIAISKSYPNLYKTNDFTKAHKNTKLL
ncbi:DUF4046 domain-containing protein [Clostridium perfringens]